jgi:hypothetical protein
MLLLLQMEGTHGQLEPPLQIDMEGGPRIARNMLMPTGVPNHA